MENEKENEKNKIIEAVKKAIDNKTKKFKKIMGPNTKKLINATDANTFKQALKKKNWLGTNLVHAAAIVVKGAVVVPADTTSIQNNINTLVNATEYENIKDIIDSFDNSSNNALKKVITKYTGKDKTTFFKTIRQISKSVPDLKTIRQISISVPDELMRDSDSSSSQSTEQQTDTNPNNKHLTTILANITYACDEALESTTSKDLKLDALSKRIDQLIVDLKTIVNNNDDKKTGSKISSNDDREKESKISSFKNRFSKFLTAIEGARLLPLSEDRLYIMQNLPVKKSAQNKIISTAEKVQKTLYSLFGLEKNLTNENEKSQLTSDAQTQTNQSNGKSKIVTQESHCHTGLQNQSANDEETQGDDTITNINPTTNDTINTSAVQTPQSTTNENNVLTKFKSVNDTLSKYSKEEKLSDEQKVEFIKDLKALKNDAPLTSYYLLTYLKKEGTALTDDERSALLETPHGDNYDYEDDYEDAKKELMDQLTEEDAVKILGCFEKIINKNYKIIKKRNKKTAMRLQAELDAVTSPIQIVSHQ